MRKLIFLGARQIAWNALIEIAKPQSRETLALVALVSDLATHEKLRTEVPELSPLFIVNDRRRSAEILEAIVETGADTLISVQHNWILTPEILDAVQGRAFNLHNAKLPEYQGYNSISHAIINGDRDFVSTIHWMDTAVDTGDIAYEEITPIESTDTALSLHKKTIVAASRAFSKLLDDIRTETPIPKQSPRNAAARFYEKNSLEEIVDISAEFDPLAIDRLARGLFYPPFNAAYRMVEGRKTYQIPASGIPDLMQSGLK